jgi:hypothetical protein
VQSQSLDALNDHITTRFYGMTIIGSSTIIPRQRSVFLVVQKRFVATYQAVGGKIEMADALGAKKSDVLGRM